MPEMSRLVRRWFPLALVLSGCGAASPSATQPKAVVSASAAARPPELPLLERARQLVGTGRYPEALALLRSGPRASDAERLQAAALEAEALRRAGNLREAESVLAPATSGSCWVKC
jgi:hypothetical protein